MAEKNERETKFRKEIPEEARVHLKKARQEMRQAFEGLLPEGFVSHRRSGRREMLLAWREIIDSAIQHMEKEA